MLAWELQMERETCETLMGEGELTSTIQCHSTSSCKIVILDTLLLNQLLRHCIAGREEHRGGDTLRQEWARGQLHLVPASPYQYLVSLKYNLQLRIKDMTYQRNIFAVDTFTWRPVGCVKVLQQLPSSRSVKSCQATDDLFTTHELRSSSAVGDEGGESGISIFGIFCSGWGWSDQ